MTTQEKVRAPGAAPSAPPSAHALSPRETLLNALTPSTMDEVMKFADRVSQTDMVPECYKGKAGNVLVAWAMGAEVGLSMMQALQNIAVINGRPSIWGDAALALVKGHPDCTDVIEKFEGEGDNLKAICIAKRKGKSDVTQEFSVADAKKAGLWQIAAKIRRQSKYKPGETYEVDNDSPWWKYPKRMLQMRARGFCLRDQFGDVLRGLNIAEEAGDIITLTDADYRQVDGEDIPMPTARAAQDAAAEATVVQEMAAHAFAGQGAMERAIDEAAQEAPPADDELTAEEYEAAYGRPREAATASASAPTKEAAKPEPVKPAPEKEPAKPAANGGTIKGTSASRVLASRVMAAKLHANQLCEAFKIKALEDLPASKINEAFQWIEQQVKPR